MSLLTAIIRNTKSKGEIKSLRNKGMVPGIIYGGEEPNQKISVPIKEIKNLLNKENILSNMISLNIDGKEQKVLPRVIDFKGLSKRSFDGNGNYSLGLKEQIIFPEINYDKIDKVRGLDVSIVTSASNDKDALELLKGFNFPFNN